MPPRYALAIIPVDFDVPLNAAGILHKCHSWQDIQFQLEPLSKSEKGDCFETLSHYFLLLAVYA